MSIRRQFWVGGIVLSGGQGVTLVLSFVRNVMFARMLGLRDMGVAALLALVVYLLDVISNLNLGTMLIQAEDGDDPQLQLTGHTVMLVRSLGCAALLLLLARPTSTLFGVPGARWAFAVLAAVPLLRGLTHLDLMRQQRKMEFGRFVAVDVGTQIVLAALTWPLAWWFRSYAAMLWILVIQAALTAIGSHLIARRRFAVGWDRKCAKRMVSFGWPLLINGLLMFLIFEGDRFIIGAAQRLFPASHYTLEDLGLYSVAFALALTPVSAIGKVGVSLLLPLLSRVQKDANAFRRRYEICVQLACLSAALISVPLLLQGDRVIVGLYGEKYLPATCFFAMFVLMQSIRMIRMAPTLAALALGDTRNGMFANAARTSSFAFVCIAAAMNLHLIWIAASGVVGELLAILCSLFLLSSRLKVPVSTSAGPILTTLAIFGVSSVLGFAKFLPSGLWPTLSICVLISAGSCVLVLSVSPRLCQEIRMLIARKLAARAIEARASSFGG